MGGLRDSDRLVTAWMNVDLVLVFKQQTHFHRP